MGTEIQVKSIANLGIDPAFVVAPEHRSNPTPTHKTASISHSIPVIDLNSTQTSPDILIKQVRSACRDWGFFQVVNHGIHSDLIRSLQSEAANFFSQPLHEKNIVRRDFDNPLGYYDTELTKNVRDWKEVFDYTCKGVIKLPLNFDGDSNETQALNNQWPENPPQFREACEKYAKAIEKLSFRLMGLISQSLGLPSDYFDSKFEEHTSFLRLNHYPPCPAPHLALGVSRHKDSGALTVLLQDDVEGLQVKRKDGEWITVKPVAGAFIINVGDCVQVWSNDKYESVEHRVVVNDKRERFSVPFFLNPSHYVMIAPVPELINEKNPVRYKAFNWGKFYKKRKDGNFRNLGTENLQIYHFSISPNSS